jgi:hypothetical protein
MNTHTFRHMEIDGPETMNWTPVALSVREPVALLHSKGTSAQSLMRCAYRIGKIATSTLFFLTLGATGLWAVVDLAKLVIEWWKDR